MAPTTKRSLPEVTPFGAVLIVATVGFGVAAIFTLAKPVLIGLAAVLGVWIFVMISRGPPKPPGPPDAR